MFQNGQASISFACFWFFVGLCIGLKNYARKQDFLQLFLKNVPLCNIVINKTHGNIYSNIFCN